MSEENQLADSRKLFSSNVLKLIAVVTMFMDHFAKIIIKGHIIPNLEGSGADEKFVGLLVVLYYVMICAGRLAFPIYAFLITEGFRYTKSIKMYSLRLGIFALLSEVPFNLAFTREFLNPEKQNVMFTLLGGLMSIVTWSSIVGCKQGKSPIFAFKAASPAQQYAAFGTVVMIALICFIGRVDYRLSGVMVIFTFYFLHDLPLVMFAAVGTLLILTGRLMELPAIFAFVPIYFYNGKLSNSKAEDTGGKKQKVIKMLFYAFYPAHLLLLFLVRFLLVKYI